MKIGLVTDSSLTVPGGVQEYMRGLHDSLRDQGEDAQIISAGTRGEEDKGRRFTSLGGSVDLGALRWGGAASSLPLNWVSPARIRAFLRVERFDVLHYAGPTGILGSEILALSRGASPDTLNVLAFLIYDETTPLVIEIAFSLYRRLNRLLDARVAISEPAADYAQKSFPGSYKVIPCGVDTARFNPGVDKVSDFVDGRINLLFAGRLDRRKNVLGMIDVYSRLRVNCPETRLIVVGDGPQRRAAQALCQERHLRDVVFAGAVPAAELPGYFNTCDIFCAPTLNGESFGVVLVEAMACGKPIAGYGNEGYQSVVNGTLLQSTFVEPADAAGLERVLEDLILDEALRKRLGDEALRKVQQTYSWDIVSARMLEFYRSLRR